MPIPAMSAISYNRSMKTLFILAVLVALTACEHEEDADLESQLDACEEELCNDEGARLLCIGMRFDRRALNHDSVVPDEGKLRRVPISMLIVYKEQLQNYYCYGEMKDRIERFDGVMYEKSELPAPKDTKDTKDNPNTANNKEDTPSP